MSFWILQLLTLPRRAVTIVTFLLMLAFVVIMWLPQAQGPIFGRIEKVTVVGSDGELLRIGFPLRAWTIPLLASNELMGRIRLVKEGDWIFAFGRREEVQGRSLFISDEIVPLLPMQVVVNTSAWRDQLVKIPPITILLGCSALIAGTTVIRAMAGILCAIIGAFVVWHGTQAAVLVGSIVPGSSVYSAAAAGGMVGFVLGWRSAGGSGSILQRLTAATLLFLFIPFLGVQFGWPGTLSAALAFTSLVVPIVAHAVIGAGLLAAGLEAHGSAVTVMLIASAFTVAIMSPHWRLAPCTSLSAPGDDLEQDRLTLKRFSHWRNSSGTPGAKGGEKSPRCASRWLRWFTRRLCTTRP